jgi:hypothetical protein
MLNSLMHSGGTYFLPQTKIAIDHAQRVVLITVYVSEMVMREVNPGELIPFQNKVMAEEYPIPFKIAVRNPGAVRAAIRTLMRRAMDRASESFEDRAVREVEDAVPDPRDYRPTCAAFAPTGYAPSVI